MHPVGIQCIPQDFHEFRKNSRAFHKNFMQSTRIPCIPQEYLLEPATTVAEPKIILVESATTVVVSAAIDVDPTTIAVERATIVVEPAKKLTEPTLLWSQQQRLRSQQYFFVEPATIIVETSRTTLEAFAFFVERAFRGYDLHNSNKIMLGGKLLYSPFRSASAKNDHVAVSLAK